MQQRGLSRAAFYRLSCVAVEQVWTVTLSVERDAGWVGRGGFSRAPRRNENVSRPGSRKIVEDGEDRIAQGLNVVVELR